MPRRRPLRPEEEEIWQAVARTAQPLHPQKARPTHAGGISLPAALAQEKPKVVAAALASFRVGERAGMTSSHVASAGALATPLRMDAKAFARMSRGKLAPEARIDLHGMTLAEAQPELTGFILTAQMQGLRLVLVITGKGRRGGDDGPIPQRHGVLKHQVPQWLRQPPLGSAVLQVAEAHFRHGGGGAYYVYLRRAR